MYRDDVMNTERWEHSLVMMLVVTASLDSCRSSSWVVRTNCTSVGRGGGKDSTNIQRHMVYGMRLNFHVKNIIGLFDPNVWKLWADKFGIKIRTF